MSDVNFLEKEGNRDEIFARLSTALDAGYREGRYSARFYAQAAGRQPHSLEAGTRSQDVEASKRMETDLEYRKYVQSITR